MLVPFLLQTLTSVRRVHVVMEARVWIMWAAFTVCVAQDFKGNFVNKVTMVTNHSFDICSTGWRHAKQESCFNKTSMYSCHSVGRISITSFPFYWFILPRRKENKPFPSSLVPLFQSKSKLVRNHSYENDFDLRKWNCMQNSFSRERFLT